MCDPHQDNLGSIVGSSARGGGGHNRNAPPPTGQNEDMHGIMTYTCVHTCHLQFGLSRAWLNCFMVQTKVMQTVPCVQLFLFYDAWAYPMVMRCSPLSHDKWGQLFWPCRRPRHWDVAHVTRRRLFLACVSLPQCEGTGHRDVYVQVRIMGEGRVRKHSNQDC